ISNLIGKDELKQAMQEMQAFFSQSPKLYEIIHQSGRYQSVVQAIQRGNVSFEDAEITKNQVRFALLQILQDIVEQYEQSPELKSEIDKATQSIGQQILHQGQGDIVMGEKGNIVIKEISGSVKEMYGGGHTEVHNTYNEESEETRKFRRVIADFFNGLNKFGQFILLAVVGIVLVFVLFILPMKIVGWAFKPITQPFDNLTETTVIIGDLLLYGTSDYTMTHYQDEYELVSFLLPGFLTQAKQPAFSSVKDSFNIKFGNFNCNGCGNHIEITIVKTPWASLNDEQWYYLRKTSLGSVLPDSTYHSLFYRHYRQDENRRYGKEEYLFSPTQLDSLFISGVILDFQDHILFEVKYLFSQRVYRKMDSIWTIDNFRWNPIKAASLLRYSNIK
ncbi:MAG: hypothetical protein KDD63_17040, partial [Bacteroidetes bacterium]|nr:hypothetical protein [Bacteroidota bacterium]